MNLETMTIGEMPAVSLEERRDTLYARLDAGYARIQSAIERGEDVHRWEQGWMRLLHEYEEICDQIDRRGEFRAA